MLPRPIERKTYERNRFERHGKERHRDRRIRDREIAEARRARSISKPDPEPARTLLSQDALRNLELLYLLLSRIFEKDQLGVIRGCIDQIVKAAPNKEQTIVNLLKVYGELETITIAMRKGVRFDSLGSLSGKEFLLKEEMRTFAFDHLLSVFVGRDVEQKDFMEISYAAIICVAYLQNTAIPRSKLAQ